MRQRGPSRARPTGLEQQEEVGNVPPSQEGQWLEGAGLCDTSVGNAFRSNVEFHEKPRQLLVLGVLMGFTVYLGYSHRGDEAAGNTRAAAMAVAVMFLTHCFLQCRDTVIIRPHPGVWRVVHGLGMLYLMAMAVLLVQDKTHARHLVGVFFEDIGPLPTRKPPGSEPFQDCALNLSTVKRQLTEIWFVAHALGWWGKMVMFRDWGVCWILSLAFEAMECSLQFIIPEFKECWWDSLLIDLLGANLLGMVAGWYTLKLMETNVYDWSGATEPKRGRIRRFVNSLSPYSFTRYRWSVFSSFKRFLQVMALVLITLAMELNAFMLLHTLQLPKASAFNKVRLALMALLAVPAAAEYYDFIANPLANRLGQNAWCIIAIMQLEIVVWLKFWPSSLVLTSPPPDVHLPWTITLTLLGVWMFLSLTLVKQHDLGARTITTPRNRHRTPGGFNSNSNSRAGQNLIDARMLLASPGEWSDGSTGEHHRRKSGPPGERRMGEVDVDPSRHSTASTASPASIASPLQTSPTRRALGAGGLVARGKQVLSVGVVQELIDMMFFLSFVPLVWLVKQWAF